MIGIIPGSTKTYEIMGDFNSAEKEEGKLYFDPKDNRLYMFSEIETRSSPRSGYFPIWNGKQKFVSKFSNMKYFDDSIPKVGIDELCNSLDNETADRVRRNQRRTDHQDLLKPEIFNEDNFFTQIIKGTISAMNVSIFDLIEEASPKLNATIVESMYNSLSKITLMRLDKWLIWMNSILHKSFVFTIVSKGKVILEYTYPQNEFSVNDDRVKSILESKDDFLKKIIKIVMITEEVNKNDLRSETTDEYTINNLMTSLNGSKPLSAQLFSRFMRMAHFSYTIDVMDNGDCIFEFKDQ